MAKLLGEFQTLHTQVLAVRSLVALHIKQRVSVVDEISPIRTVRDILSLTMSGYEEAMSCSHWSWKTRKALWTIRAGRTRVPTLTWDSNTHMFYKRNQIVFLFLALMFSSTHQADQQVQCLPFCQVGQQNREDPPSLNSQVHLVGLSASSNKGSFIRWPCFDVLVVILLLMGRNGCTELKLVYICAPGSPSRPGEPGGPRLPGWPETPGGPRSPLTTMGAAGTPGSPGGPSDQM